MAVSTNGVWVARHGDRSGLIPFASEIEALRHAVDNHMQVVWVPYGEDALTYEKPAAKQKAPTYREQK